MAQFAVTFGARYRSCDGSPLALSGSMVTIESNSRAMRLSFIRVPPAPQRNGDPSVPWLHIVGAVFPWQLLTLCAPLILLLGRNSSGRMQLLIHRTRLHVWIERVRKSVPHRHDDLALIVEQQRYTIGVRVEGAEAVGFTNYA